MMLLVEDAVATARNQHRSLMSPLSSMGLG